MDVRVSVRPGRECMVVEVAGDLDLITAPYLHEGLRKVIDDGARNVVADLTGVEFMDSSGLGALVVMYKVARERGSRLCVAASTRPVRNLLAITSVDQAIDVYDTVPDAESSMA